MERRAARACPLCGADSVVYNSRQREDGTIERRRRCQACGLKFSTIEKFKGIVDWRNEYGE